MSIASDRERLSQAHNLEWIGRDPKVTEMVTVYRWNLEDIRGDYFILGGLIPTKLVEEILSGEHISSVIENVWPRTPRLTVLIERVQLNTFAGVLMKICMDQSRLSSVVSLVK